MSDANPTQDNARTALLQSGLRLEAFTVTWNVVEAVVAIGAGIASGSVALVGFGLDSVIETIAATALYQRLRAELRGASDEEAETQERRALKIVGYTFFALAAYIVFEAGSALWSQERPSESTLGIGLAVLSLLVMPFLAFRKLSVGRALESRALIADAKETFACSYLSVALLFGLGLNALFGIWWADPVAALLMVPWVLNEGREALEDECDD